MDPISVIVAFSGVAYAGMLLRYVINGAIKAPTGFLCWTGRVNCVLHIFHGTVDIFSGALSRPLLHTASEEHCVGHKKSADN